MSERVLPSSYGGVAAVAAPSPLCVSVKFRVCARRWVRTARSCGGMSRRLAEGADAGDVSADDEGLHGLGAFEGVNALDVRHVSHDMVFHEDSVAAQ